MRAVIVLPTYNERDNILPIVSALYEVFERIPHEMHILVVDDNSPDGTGDIVREAQQRFERLHLLEGDRAGLGAAYIRGMRHALSALESDVVFEMDADFSHDPQDVPRLLAEIEAGYDFVIGSRYVPGGSIPENWGALRRAISLGGNLVARLVAGLYRVRDCTAGFRAIRARLLDKIDFDELRVRGYAFQVALLNAAVGAGARVQEIPVHFVDRSAGESKLGISDVVEFIINAWWIRLRGLGTFIKFAAVGLTGVFVNLGCFTGLLMAGVNEYVASPIAIELSVIWNFFLNNYWTFGSRKTSDRTHIKGLKFNAVSFVSLILSYGVFIGSSFAFPSAPAQLHQGLGIIPGAIANYFLNAYWTFRSDD